MLKITKVISPGKQFFYVLLLLGFQVNPAQAQLRALVSSQHGVDYSRAAINIESQVGVGRGRLTLGDTNHRFRLHGPSTGIGEHYQGVGFLRDKTIWKGWWPFKYRRAALSYNSGHGFMVSSASIGISVADGVLAWDSSRLLRFQGYPRYLDIINEPRMGNHAHPGGFQSHGDMVAIAMEQPQTSRSAAVYFIRVDGLVPSFVTSLSLGTGGAPRGLDLDSAAASGFIKLRSGGYLVAVSGASHGTDGIWFYKTNSTEINSRTRWSFVDFWTPDRMPRGLCNIEDGKHATNCYAGAGGGLSLVANNDGRIYLIATTGTSGWGYNDEYAQMYEVIIQDSPWPTRVRMRGVWSDKKKLGWLATKRYSMRWAGAAHTTESGRLLLLNTERKNNALSPVGAADGIMRIAQ